MATLRLEEGALFARISEILSESFEVDPGAIHPGAHLVDDLDLDSIDAIDLAVKLEEETGLEVSEKEIRKITIVQDVVDLVLARLGAS